MILFAGCHLRSFSFFLIAADYMSGALRRHRMPLILFSAPVIHNCIKNNLLSTLYLTQCEPPPPPPPFEKKLKLYLRLYTRQVRLRGSRRAYI